MESRNRANSVIFYGKGGDIATNRRDEQELSVLCLRVLQAALVYVNTLMVQDVLYDKNWSSGAATIGSWVGQRAVEGGPADLEERGDLGDGFPAGLPRPGDGQGVGVDLGPPATVSAFSWLRRRSMHATHDVMRIW